MPQQDTAQGLLSLLTKGACLLRQAAQYLLSTVYRLTVDRRKARIGRVWQPYGQVNMDIRHIRIHQSIPKRCVGDLNTNDCPVVHGCYDRFQDDGVVQSHETASLNSGLSYKLSDTTSHCECPRLNYGFRREAEGGGWVGWLPLSAEERTRSRGRGARIAVGAISTR